MTGKVPKRAPAPDRGGSSTDVETFLASLEHPLEREIRALRAIIRGVDPRIGESVKWNAPSFSMSEHFATFHLRNRGAVQVVLHLGARPRPDAALRAAITDPAGLLEWRGADRAIVTFRGMADVESKQAAFAAVVRQWITFVQ